MIRNLRPMLGAAIAGLIATTASPAAACRMLQPTALGLDQYETVILASVVEAEPIENPGWYTWRITARAIQNVSGEAGSSTYEFTSTLYSDGCGFQSPIQPPPAGERWVLYFAVPGSSEVRWAFPLDYVRGHDPRLADEH